MSQKRQSEDGKGRFDGGSPDDQGHKVPRFRSVVHEVMRIHNLQQVLEPLIRKVVKEEVDLALRKHLTNVKWGYGNEVHPSEQRSLQLQFLNNISLPVFTGARIEGDTSSFIRFALVDTLSGQIVNSGPESSAKVEIVVLEGDFDSDEGNNWTLEEFKNNIVREREGKKPLLTGDVILNLKEGVGLVEDISFTDNSSWTRSRRFRLGARAVDNYDGLRIREAKTDSFIVRDHRGELYKKHHPPSLLDDVWRLEKIGKDGAFHKRLSREKVYTVKDFLVLLTFDPSRLRNILGTGMSAKMWEVTVEHARTCVLDNKIYVYYMPGSQQKTGVGFNVVGQLMGVISDCQYITMDKLSEKEKADAQLMIISAFQHWGEVISLEDEASLTGGSSHLNHIQYTSGSPRTESSIGSKFLTSQKIDGFDYSQPVSPDIVSSIFSIGDMSGLDDYPLHVMNNTDIRYDQTFNYPGQASNPLVYDTGSVSQTFCDDHLQFLATDISTQTQNHNIEPLADLHSVVDGFRHMRPRAVKTGKAQGRWAVLFSVLQWFSIRKTVRSRSQKLKTYSYPL